MGYVPFVTYGVFGTNPSTCINDSDCNNVPVDDGYEYYTTGTCTNNTCVYTDNCRAGYSTTGTLPGYPYDPYDSTNPEKQCNRIDQCIGVTCQPGYACSNGACSSDTQCNADGTCPSGMHCVGGGFPNWWCQY